MTSPLQGDSSIVNMAADTIKGKTSTFSIQMGGESGFGRRPRPGSGRPASARPTDRETVQRGLHMFNRSKSGLVSYEDLLVAQYLDDLRRQKSEVRAEKELPPSPYLQRLPHANLIHGKMARRPRSHRRPMSATSATLGGHSSKPKIDAKFIADESLWDPATPRDMLQQRLGRPASAPIRRTRPISGLSTGSMRRRSYRPGSAKSMFKKQPRTITCVAFKNGTRDTFIHASASNLKILLEFVTEKLGLGFAARRIFLEDGVEIFDGNDIPPHADVYISTGENYKDPFSQTKKSMLVRQAAKWSLQGIILPEESKKRSKHRMSKRLRNLSQNTTMRIIIYRNGKSAVPHEVVVEPNKFEEFLQACTARLELGRYAKKAYDWEGNEITDLEDTPILDDCLQNKGGQVRGPLWISTGERFSPSGTLEFLKNIKDVIKQKKKNAEFYRNEKQHQDKSRGGRRQEISKKKALEMLQKKVKERKRQKAVYSGVRMVQTALSGWDHSKPVEKIMIETPRVHFRLQDEVLIKTEILQSAQGEQKKTVSERVYTVLDEKIVDDLTEVPSTAEEKEYENEFETDHSTKDEKLLSESNGKTGPEEEDYEYDDEYDTDHSIQEEKALTKSNGKG